MRAVQTVLFLTRGDFCLLIPPTLRPAVDPGQPKAVTGLRNTPTMSMPGDLGKRIKDLRERRGHTRKELAKMSGVPYSTLAGLENGDSHTARPLTLEAIAASLQCTVDWLISGDAENKPSAKDALAVLLTDAEYDLLMAYRASSVVEKKEIDGFVAGIGAREGKRKISRIQNVVRGAGEHSSSRRRRAS